MHKGFFSLVTLLIVVAIGTLFTLAYLEYSTHFASVPQLPESLKQTSPKQTPQETSSPSPLSNTTVQGVVLRNNLGCTVDGTCSLDIQVGTSQINVIYSLGWQKCNEEAAKVGIDLIEGEFIEVFARTTGENKMSTCDGTDFYIKKL